METRTNGATDGEPVSEAIQRIEFADKCIAKCVVILITSSNTHA